MTKHNNEEMAKYAKTFNQLCEKNKIETSGTYLLLKMSVCYLSKIFPYN